MLVIVGEDHLCGKCVKFEESLLDIYSPKYLSWELIPYTKENAEICDRFNPTKNLFNNIQLKPNMFKQTKDSHKMHRFLFSSAGKKGVKPSPLGKFKKGDHLGGLLDDVRCVIDEQGAEGMFIVGIGEAEMIADILKGLDYEVHLEISNRCNHSPDESLMANLLWSLRQEYLDIVKENPKWKEVMYGNV